MAGDIIEEPFRFNFQAESLRSGSISFGRFENEDLCWERRSSFSHNRYLEEVEKCSKPGSVTEKKAILEAHFKRRAGLLSQTSSESNSGIECQTSGNDLSEDNNVHEPEHSPHFGVTESGGYDGDFDHFNGCSYYTYSYDGSVYDAERESYCYDDYETHSHPDVDHEDDVDRDDEVDRDDDVEEEEDCCAVTGTVNPESKPHANGKFVKAGSGENVTSNIVISVPTSHEVDKDESIGSEPQHCFSPKESLESHLKSEPSIVNEANVNATVPNEGTKDFTRKPRRKADILVEKVVSHSVATTTYCSMSTTPKHEVSSSLKSKMHTEKEKRIKEKVAHKVNQSPSRLKSSVASTTLPSVKQSCPSFRFKSEERAERRKEFSMKLEKKMHAKEAEMHKLQATKQEKREAEMKRLRRSLNFKANPLPSFYHESGQQSNTNKNLGNKPKSGKAKSKQSSPTKLGAENNTSSSGATNSGTHLARKVVGPTSASTTTKHRPTISSDGSVSSPLPSTVEAGKNGQERQRLISSRKPKTHEGSKAGPNAPKVSARRIKGIHFGGNPRMDCLAVGVAS